MIPKAATLAVALGALAGCIADPAPEPRTTGAAEVDTPERTPVLRTPPAVPDALAAVDENLARLAALDVFMVGDLVVQLPEEAFACYGVPCPGTEEAVAEAQAEAELHAAERLAWFAGAAETAAAEAASGYFCDKETIDAHVAALDALEIVEVLGLVVEQPQNNPNCYNLPCQEDIAAAEAITQERAQQLTNIVAAVQEP
jgi:hypothetical protein